MFVDDLVGLVIGLLFFVVEMVFVLGLCVKLYDEVVSCFYVMCVLMGGKYVVV